MSRLTIIASLGRRALPNHWDLVALAAVLAALSPSCGRFMA